MQSVREAISTALMPFKHMSADEVRQQRREKFVGDRAHSGDLNPVTTAAAVTPFTTNAPLFSPIRRKLAVLLGDLAAETMTVALRGFMRRLFKLMLVLAIMVSTGYALYRIGEETRIVEKLRSPDPEAFRKLAWAELDARQLKPGMPVFISHFQAKLGA